VVAPRVDDHVRVLRHVAVGTLRPGSALFVPVVRGHVVFRRVVALRADRVTRNPHFLRVRIVAVAARDTSGVHAALQPRTPDEHLVLLLAIDVIQRGRQQ
jgi:hypothetical protein